MIRLVYCGKNGNHHEEEIEDSEVTNAHIYKLLEHIYHKQHEQSLETQLAPQLKGVLKDAVEVMRHPPATWHQYLKSRNTCGIAHMEVGELVKALEEHKSSREIRKELVHTLAALFLYAE